MLVDHKVPKMQILQDDKVSSANSVVIVVDVLNSFSTTAYALGCGAEKVILVSKVNEALALVKAIPGSLTMGSEDGKRVKEFDFDASPWSFSGIDLTGKILIQCIPAFTLSALKNVQCHKILASSFVVAEATIARIQAIAPDEVTFIPTCNDASEQDRAFAEYMIDKLQGNFDSSAAPFLRRVMASPTAKKLIELQGEYPFSDLDAVLAVDSFPFAMEAGKEGGLIVLQPVRSNGHLWR